MVRTRTLSRGGCGSSLTDVIVSTGLVLCAPRPTDGSAEACARWRAKRDAPVRTNAEAIERMLLQEVGRCEQLSDQERALLWRIGWRTLRCIISGVRPSLRGRRERCERASTKAACSCLG